MGAAIAKYPDIEHGVVCYVYDSAISCVKVKDVEP